MTDPTPITTERVRNLAAIPATGSTPGERRWVLGDRRTLVAGVTGAVTAVSVAEDWVEIEGVRMPTRITEHVKYLSLDYPGPRVDEVIVDDHDGWNDGVEDERAKWIKLAHDMHYAREGGHLGTARFCSHPICAEAARGA